LKYKQTQFYFGLFLSFFRSEIMMLWRGKENINLFNLFIIHVIKHSPARMIAD
jgi:hypothetical protein